MHGLWFTSVLRFIAVRSSSLRVSLSPLQRSSVVPFLCKIYPHQRQGPANSSERYFFRLNSMQLQLSAHDQHEWEVCTTCGAQSNDAGLKIAPHASTWRGHTAGKFQTAVHVIL